ncbi:hypothetical protein CR513_61510, partial [Mucuna pruriens]
MTGFLCSLLGFKKRDLPNRSNNGTRRSFLNSGSGRQNFGNAKFNTDAKATGETLPSNCNNDTIRSFNNSGPGKQNFGNASIPVKHYSVIFVYDSLFKFINIEYGAKFDAIT